MAVVQRKLHTRGEEMLPDELEHEQFVEISVEQRPDDGVEFPIVVVCAFGEVDDHRKRAALKLEHKGYSRRRLLKPGRGTGQRLWPNVSVDMNLGAISLPKQSGTIELSESLYPCGELHETPHARFRSVHRAAVQSCN